MKQRRKGLTKTNPIDLVVFFGYAIFLVQSGLVPVSSASPAAFTDNYTQLLNGTMQAGAILALLFSAFYVRVSGASARSSLLWLAVGVESFGCVLGLLAQLGMGFVSAQVLARILIGSGFSFVLVLWVGVFSAMPSKQAKLHVLLASLLASLLAMVCIIFLPAPGRELVTYLSAPCYLGLLVGAQKRWPSKTGAEVDEAVHLEMVSQKTGATSAASPLFSLQELKMLAVPLVCAALLVTVGPVMAFSVFTQRSGSLLMANAVSIGLALACIILLLYGMKAKRKLSITTLYFAAFPVLATSLVAMSLFGAQFELVFAVISHTVYNLVSLVAIFESLRLGREQKLPPMLLYSIFAFVIYLASTVGAWIGNAVGEFFLDSALVSGVSLILVYCLSLVMVSMFRSELKRRAAMRTNAAGEVRDPVADACGFIAQEYGLTPREAAILDHIAHGRNVPAMADKMLLSKETIRTHVKGLYRALGVHSRQEVVDMVERYVS